MLRSVDFDGLFFCDKCSNFFAESGECPYCSPIYISPAQAFSEPIIQPIITVNEAVPEDDILEYSSLSCDEDFDDIDSYDEEEACKISDKHKHIVYTTIPGHLYCNIARLLSVGCNEEEYRRIYGYCYQVSNQLAIGQPLLLILSENEAYACYDYVEVMMKIMNSIHKRSLELFEDITYRRDTKKMTVPTYMYNNCHSALLIAQIAIKICNELTQEIHDTCVKLNDLQ